MTTAGPDSILADSSVWVDYFRRAESAARHEMRRLVATGARLAITEPIAMELLAGARDEQELTMIETLVGGLPLLGIDPSTDFFVAARIHRLTRGRGQTVRKLNDCLTAAIAIRRGVELLHNDVDFEVIASCVQLHQRSLR